MKIMLSIIVYRFMLLFIAPISQNVPKMFNLLCSFSHRPSATRLSKAVCKLVLLLLEVDVDFHFLTAPWCFGKACKLHSKVLVELLKSEENSYQNENQNSYFKWSYQDLTEVASSRPRSFRRNGTLVGIQ